MMTKRLISLFVLICLLLGCAPAPASPAATTTETIPPTRTPHPTLPSTPTATNIISITQIRTPPTADGSEILTAFWSENGTSIYYVLVGEIADQPRWFEISAENGQLFRDKQLSSPPHLIYTPLIPVGGVYLEYQGLVSPSQRFHFQIIKSDNHSLHLLDNREQSKVELLETSDMNFRGAYWTQDEDSVVFGIGPEYGTFLYLYHIQERQLLSLEELIGYADPNVSEWALSPDGKYIAIVDGNQGLTLFSLDGSFATTTPGYSNNVRWAGNSQRIYFYYGDQLYNPTNIGYFDLTTNSTSALMSLNELEKSGVEAGFFDVSPDGNQLIIWQGGDIWLLSLSK